MIVWRWAVLWVAGLAALVAVGVGFRAVTAPLQLLDLRVVENVARSRDDGFTVAAHVLSYLGRSWVLVPFALITDLTLARGLSVRWSATLGVVGAIVVQNATKALVGRPRPSVHHLEHVTSSSFPSGHAAEVTAFVVAACLIGCKRAGGPQARSAIAVGSAAIIGGIAVSRVYLGVHYPTDVGAGVLLGGGCAELARRVTIRVSSQLHWRLARSDA